MSLKEKISAAFAAKNIVNEIKEAHGSGFSFQTWALQMLKTAGWVTLGLFLAHYSTPDAAANLLGLLPEDLRVALTPVWVGAMRGALNWYKNKDNEKMLVVPVGAPEAAPIAVSVKPAKPPSLLPTIPQDGAGV